MKFEDEYWILTKEDTINYAKLLVVNSECENIMDSNKPTYSYDYCLNHAKKQLKRNISLDGKQRKILTLKKIISRMKTRYETDEIVKNVFPTIEEWFDYLGTACKLNPIFRKENYDMLNKLSGLNIKPPRVLF